MDEKEEKLIAVFDEVKSILESDEYDENLRQVLHASNPGYLEIIEKRKKDIIKSDHGILIAGKCSIVRSYLCCLPFSRTLYSLYENDNTLLSAPFLFISKKYFNMSAFLLNTLY